MKKLTSMLLALVLTLTLMTGCMPAVAEEKSLNFAVTDTIGTVNPLLLGATEVVKHVLSLEFLPLVELNQDLEVVPQLAESITTDDNLTFTIKIREDATWSDGTPVTSKDVLFTFLLLTSPEAGQALLSQYVILGTDDSGHVESGATELEGVKIVDDKTVTVTTKWETALLTFCNNFGRYVFTLPEHVLGDVPRDQLLTHEWFNQPDVITGPYFMKDFDLNHYVHFEANENYFLGAPKIKYLNVNVTTSAQLLAGLQSGEIDLIQQTTGNVLMEDYEAIRNLPNVTAFTGKPITIQSVFFNVNNVPDVRIRQAMLYGIPRDMILEELIGGNGEIVDAYLCSASPYFSEELGVTPYDPEKAAALIAEAAADGADTTLTWYVNSGDVTFTSAVELISALMADLGLTIEIQTVDLATLMTVAGECKFEVMSVTYTFSPVDPYTDMTWLMSEGGWTQYINPDLDALFAVTQASTDIEEIRQAYLTINKQVVQDVPMIPVYVMSTIGAVNNRVVGIEPDVFGTLVNVHEWDVK